MVDEKTAFQLFQSAVDGNDLLSVAGIESQGIHLVHPDGEFVIEEQAVLGEELEHTSEDATRELEVLVFLQGDSAVIRHDDHALAVAQRDGGTVDTVDLAGDAENEQIVGAQVKAQIGLTVGGPRMQLNHVIVDFFLIGVNHVEETRQGRRPLGLSIIFHIAFGLQAQQQRDDLFPRIAEI